MTDRDHFAAAALTGLLAQGDDGSFSEESYVRAAYRWADAMLLERGNQPEPPDSSPVTEPMPKEKLAEVSDGWRRHIRPPDAADRALAAACDKAWGIAAEPVAWAVTMGDGSVYEAFAAHQRDEAVELATKCLFGSDRPLPLAPLYRQPTLTDAEREAIECALIWVNPERQDALRGLLERLW